MDPVSAALIAGITQTGDAAQRSAYASIKALVVARFGDQSDIAEAIAALEAKPSSLGRQNILQEEVAAAGADKDADLVQAANAVLALTPTVEQTQRRAVSQQASGTGNIQAVDSQVNVSQYQFLPKPPVSQAELDAGSALLEQLPVDHVPALATLPHGSFMPLTTNPLFVGREADLKALAAALKAGRTSAITPIAAATGTGGIGKTQLATEFVHRYGQFFAGGVFWLGFEKAENVPAAIATAGAGLELRPDYGTLPLEDQVRTVLGAWQSALPRLLIFDNCEDEALLDQWRPPTGSCRVLVTSRRASWNPTLGVTAHPLGILSRAESIALLRKHRPDLAADDKDLDAIAEFVGDLPLALQLAGSFLRLYGTDVTTAQYLAELQTTAGLQHESFMGKEDLPTRHDRSLDTTIRLSYQRLAQMQPTDALALKLLARAAYFAAGEPIPRDLLLATLQVPEHDRDAARQATRALKRLTDLGLIDEVSDGAIRVHRLVATFTQAEAYDGAAQKDVEVSLYRILRPKNATGIPSEVLPFQKHLRTTVAAALPRADIDAATLANELAYHLYVIGEYSFASSLFDQALEIYEHYLGANNLRTAQSLNNLGSLLTIQGKYANARSILERALAIREDLLEPTHPLIAQSLNNLAELDVAQGNYIEPQEMYERALAINEQHYGVEHPATAQSRANLATLFLARGDYTSALPLLTRALATNEQRLGPDHPDTAKTLDLLGQLLYRQGNYTGAQPLFKRALSIREQQLGPQHPDTIQSLNNLAGTHYAQGNYDTAHPLFESVLAAREQRFGRDHIITAESLNNLALLLEAQGDYAAARLLFERALTTYQKQLGPNHPHTNAVRQNLASL